MKICVVMLILVAVEYPGARAEDVQFINVTSFAYDLGTVLTTAEYTDGALIGKLTAFAGSQATRHRLSRLTVSLKELDLRMGMPGRTLGFQNPSDFNRRGMPGGSLAQVLCLNGVASALIKTGLSVRRVQILGSHDPRDLTVAGHSVRMISFKIDTFNPSLYQLSGDSSEDSITIYVQANPLLSTAQAAELQSVLSSAVGTDKLALLVRTDSLFGDMDGPPFDIFQVPYPDITEATYKASSYIVCAPAERKPRGTHGPETAKCVVKRRGDVHGIRARRELRSEWTPLDLD